MAKWCMARVVMCRCCGEQAYQSVPDTGIPTVYACWTCDNLGDWPSRPEKMPRRVE